MHICRCGKQYSNKRDLRKHERKQMCLANLISDAEIVGSRLREDEDEEEELLETP